MWAMWTENRPKRAVSLVTATLATMVCVVGHSSVNTPGFSVVRAEEAQEIASATQTPVTHTVGRATPAMTLEIPPVLLTDAHQKLCRVAVGDAMPAMTLPQLGGRTTALADLYGEQATVVVFWKRDRRMAKQQLEDLGGDVVDPFTAAGVNLVVVAVSEPERQIRAAVSAAKLRVPVLVDRDGEAFAKVGAEKLPRTYVLDAEGKIVWFDIEYSLATRRELAQVLHVLTNR